MKLGQKGFVHLLLLLILLGGLVAGVILATSKDPLKLFSRAFQGNQTTIEGLTQGLIQSKNQLNKSNVADKKMNWIVWPI